MQIYQNNDSNWPLKSGLVNAVLIIFCLTSFLKNITHSFTFVSIEFGKQFRDSMTVQQFSNDVVSSQYVTIYRQNRKKHFMSQA